jgi:hypothetical protein
MTNHTAASRAHCPSANSASRAAAWQAAQDAAPQVRLIAGPGTGESATIERRVAHVLNSGAPPDRVFVISFTRATCAELTSRISAFCAGQPCAAAAASLHVSTMHSLALRILRSAAVSTTLYPSDPVVLDDWEREHVYDVELENALGCPRTRAGQVRLAHDAQWQTLNPQFIAQPGQGTRAGPPPSRPRGVFSAYELRDGTRIWILTEGRSDRHSYLTLTTTLPFARPVST